MIPRPGDGKLRGGDPEVTGRHEAERYPYRPSRIVDSVAELAGELGSG